MKWIQVIPEYRYNQIVNKLIKRALGYFTPQVCPKYAQVCSARLVLLNHHASKCNLLGRAQPVIPPNVNEHNDLGFPGKM